MLSDFQNAVQHSKKTIAYRLQELGLTEQEIISKKMKDEFLGVEYSLTAWSYNFLYSHEKYKYYLILSAICGNEDSIGECKKLGFTY
jgi:hypothetical protein